MKRLVPLIILFNLYACILIKDDISFPGYDDILFEGNQKSKKEAVELLDIVLKEQGNLGVYGDLSAGTGDLQNDMKIKIEDKNDYYSIYIYPKNSTGGHDFSFRINKKTKKRSDVAIGEVLPPPNFDK